MELLKELFDRFCLKYPLKLTEWIETKQTVQFTLTKADKMNYNQHLSKTIIKSEIDCEKIEKHILNSFRFIPKTKRVSRFQRFINKFLIKYVKK